ncbi:hypothetical protein DICPUDRAFT_47438 [Dictyostelium purpureum]|uniref:Protein kinase domain-containing protein n=1 Tax=Dictyostelium purpureum TaxID=5786 RepID=F0ZJJ4_DICPU|nr:uncharacterized protein DICPUDRAFT_47438 [Dictyostelium purpureum]EGC35873.1 hypothetical protein DICPUDRAFT_47438 [Dictyostelium purpureum]|eukprot:XP_003287604.1 hypothetical protein DICPUDRAFT_47438 [Dictyostelium purpureum]
MESFVSENWEILKALRENVFIVENKNNILINGNSFKKCILKKVIIIVETNVKSTKEGIILNDVLTDSSKIVKLYGVQKDGDYTCLFIQYIEGSTLQEYIERNHPLSNETIGSITTELLQLLNYIHSKEVIHRDLSPSNIIYDENEKKWKLLDFGLSFYFSGKEEGSKNYSLVGTPGLFSPETFGRKAGSRKSDVWQFGCLVILLLGGKLKPIHPDEAEGIRDKDLIPDIPENAHKLCRNFIKKCFIYDPYIRFDSNFLNSHPFITYQKEKKNCLQILSRDHRLWVEATQKKKGIENADKTFFFNGDQELKVDTIPEGTVHLIFGNDFNGIIPDGAIPQTVKIVDFGTDGKSIFNQILTRDNFPRGVESLTLGNHFEHDIPVWPNKIKYLSVGTKRNQIKGLCSKIETLKYYGTLKEPLIPKNIPSQVFNLLMPLCNGPIKEGTIPDKVNFFAWGSLNEEDIETLMYLPKSIDDLQFLCPKEVFEKLEKKHIPKNVSILLINGKLIDLDGEDSLLHKNIIC